jgi:hypothetical protein
MLCTCEARQQRGEGERGASAAPEYPAAPGHPRRAPDQFTRPSSQISSRAERFNQGLTWLGHEDALPGEGRGLAVEDRERRPLLYDASGRPLRSQSGRIGFSV